MTGFNPTACGATAQNKVSSGSAKALTEAVSSTTLVADALRRSRVISEAISPTSLVSDALSRSRALSETISSISLVADTLNANRATSETISSASAVAEALSRSGSLSEALTPISLVSDTLTGNRALSEDIGPSSDIEDALSRSRPLSETIASVSDVSDMVTGRTSLSPASCIATTTAIDWSPRSYLIHPARATALTVQVRAAGQTIYAPAPQGVTASAQAGLSIPRIIITPSATPATGVTRPILQTLSVPDGFRMLELVCIETIDPLTDDSVSLRWSDSKGASWGNAVERSLGKVGEYATNVHWRRLGQGRDRIFEISFSSPHQTAILGAFIETEVAFS